jgi:hypothetical protein
MLKDFMGGEGEAGALFLFFYIEVCPADETDPTGIEYGGASGFTRPLW